MGRTAVQNVSGIHYAVTPDTEADHGYDALARLNQDGDNTLSLLVEGVHCAACIQKIESSLNKISGVKYARLNFSTGSLNIVWDGPTTRADQMVTLVESLGYTVRPYSPSLEKLTSEKEDRFLLFCLGVAGFSMGNIMLLSVGLWVSGPEDMGASTRDFLHLISGIIAIPTVLFSGRPFFRSAFNALKSGTTNMDVPISVGLILATGISLFETFNHGAHAYFDSAVMLIFFLLIGRYLDFRARRIATNAAKDLLQTFNGFASILENGKIRKIPIRDLQEDMIVSVAAGENFPCDSSVENGQSSVDTSLVTGETLPRDIAVGSMVYAGTLNISSPVTVRVLKATSDSLLADIVRLMEKAEQSQSQYVRLADRAAKLYTPVVHALALIAFIYWFGFAGLDWQKSLMIAATVLIITCPCALGLAVPVVQVIAIGRLMKSGILVKSGDALERLAKINTIIFDKTGTLTHGKPELTSHNYPQDLQLAASLASHSKHVLSQALTRSYQGEILPMNDVQEIPGKGLQGLYHGHSIRVGRRDWCGDTSAPMSEGPEIWLKTDGMPPVLFSFSDTLKEDAKRTIQSLKNDQLRTVLLSGDRQEETSRISHELEINEYYGEKTPVQKYEVLKSLKDKNHNILMVGDGLNDAPVLMGADISMAPGSAIDMAQNAADIVFMGEKLAPVQLAYKISRKTQKLIFENFALAILYNAIAIPMAFAGYVTPLIAALAMSGSSILVVANSFRLRLEK